MTQIAQDTLLDSIRKVIGGIQKRLSNVNDIKFQNMHFTPVALMALFQSLIDALLAAQAAEAARQAAVTAARDARKKVLPIFRQFIHHVRDEFGNSAPDLADFGLDPTPGRKVTTAMEKAQAVVKREATRVARHTMGRRQREQVKGGETPPATTAPSPGNGTPAKPAAG